jgi:uncharacterized SAM-binding protein YcdF (DUF218 family)
MRRWFGRRRDTRDGGAARRRAAVLLLAVFLIIAIWASLDAGRALVVSLDIGAPDAIVMLASHEWERLPAAAALARRYPSSVVLLTMPIEVTRFNCHLCTERPAWLQHEGIAQDRIIQLAPNPVSTTYGEALAVRAYAAAHPFQRLVVVTSPYHCRRALHVFEHVMQGSGVEVGVQPASAYSIADPVRWWRHPYDRWYVTYEWAANVEYRFKYRIPIGNQ